HRSKFGDLRFLYNCKENHPSRLVASDDVRLISVLTKCIFDLSMVRRNILYNCYTCQGLIKKYLLFSLQGQNNRYHSCLKFNPTKEDTSAVLRTRATGRHLTSVI